MAIEIHDYIGPTRAAKLLGIGRMTLWRWIRGDKITHVLMDGRTVIPRSEIDRINKEAAGADKPAA